MQEWNVMPHIKRGSKYVFFAALCCSCLGLLPCLQAWSTRDCNKGSNWRRNYFNKLWLLLDFRAELDLRSKSVICIFHDSDRKIDRGWNEWMHLPIKFLIMFWNPSLSIRHRRREGGRDKKVLGIIKRKVASFENRFLHRILILSCRASDLESEWSYYIK